MSRAALAFAVVGLSAAFAPAAASAQAVPQFQFSVRNNTLVALTCTFKQASDEAEAIELAPGAEWRDRAPAQDSVGEIRCQKPVKQVLYRVVPGDRYAFLRKNAAAAVKLRKVNPQ